jgi:hypothetical protein
MSEDRHALAAVQRAAVERALLGDDAPHHLALVGAVETARVADADPPLPVLAALAAVAGLHSVDQSRDLARRPSPTDAPPTPPSPSSPGPTPDSRFRRDGAVVAHRRFDVPLDHAAALADVPLDAVRARVRSRDLDD